jgi:hypothetical protein
MSAVLKRPQVRVRHLIASAVIDATSTLRTTLIAGKWQVASNVVDHTPVCAQLDIDIF